MASPRKGNSPASGTPEAWLRGPIADIGPLLQPVAHALVEALEEVEVLTRNFPNEKLWVRPSGAASAGFHLQHISGVVDRLFTYARGQSLSVKQLRALENEGLPARPDITAADLCRDFCRHVEEALDQLRLTPDAMLTDACDVGRQKLSSTVLGLLFHAAEHVQRHVGQLLVTVKILTDKTGADGGSSR